MRRITANLPTIAAIAWAAALAGPARAQLSTAPAPISAPPAGIEATYLANEGFLIEGAGKRVLVDALLSPDVTGYAGLPAELREPIELGTDGWGGVHVALASHSHPDHFDSASVARFLTANPEAVFVSTPQAVAELARRDPADQALLARVRGVLPAAGEVERLDLQGIQIEVLNLHHGDRNPPVQNLGFVVTLGDRRFLHFGDTEAKIEDFEPYLGLLRGTDLALLPFWFLSSEWRAAMVRDRIRPRWIVVGHLPLPDAPPGHFARWQSFDNLVATIREGFPEAIFPGRPGFPVCYGDSGQDEPTKR